MDKTGKAASNVHRSICYFFLFLSLPQIHFWGGEMLAVFSTALVFCPCQHSPNEIPQKSGGEGSTHAPVHRANTARQTHLSRQRSELPSLSPFLSLLKFHIEIPSCHSASPALSLSRQPVTKSASVRQRGTHMHIETHTSHNPNFS